MKDYSTLDAQNRDRTYADRKAFILSEQTLEMAKAIAESAAPKAPTPLSTDTIIDPNWAKNRDRQSIRESIAAARRSAFLRVLGELTFNALPLDAHEKAPFRETVLSQTAELAASLEEKWELSSTGRELLETAAGLIETAEGWEDVVAASLKDGELAPMVEHVSAEVERRVIGAVVADRERSEVIENRLAEVTAVSTGDPELDAYRARKATQKGTSASLIEALYVANRRSLAEAAGDNPVSADLVMIEAVCQYALVETLSAVGVMAIDRVDVDMLVRRLMARKD